jgi:DNA recombination protein RmuC
MNTYFFVAVLALVFFLCQFVMLYTTLNISKKADIKMLDIIKSSLDSHEKEIEEGMSNIQREVYDMRISNLESLNSMKDENRKSLDMINDTVNEKLQKTLDERITRSFDIVSKRLTDVYESLGEMKDVASGVNDLKKVLSNVKTRGIIGEYQLEAILKDILTPDQYEMQFQLTPGSLEKVDFAIKLPGASDGSDYIYLPVDSKFPGDTYQSLLNAYDTGDVAVIKAARQALAATVKSEAKSIHDKYVDPPRTTDFAIMFLPFEGLYSEVINLGLLEALQNSYKINIAGPSTMAAMLNSFRMGFRTLAIQKKSGEVWKTLEAVKKEFSTFETGLGKMKERLSQADQELEKLIGVRTNAINRKLRSVSEMETLEEAEKLLDI